ncbi:hypothetical protein [Rudaea sp. 3F27F6]|uniref:hypothetical protein n=1 Tax=Rudaea sp. 3F27F6 TaxID=2502208 RepID=UPI0010F494CB|nr:hypothetical protein [Rudaea sp. 3F27F6]
MKEALARYKVTYEQLLRALNRCVALAGDGKPFGWRALEPYCHKRDQTLRALYAYAAPRGHLFFIIDEAQEINELELCWLKAIINWLVRRDCRVTVVMFGQQELLILRDTLITNARSDLDVRYTSELYEFENIRDAKDLSVTFAACDESSEFPVGSGCSYSHFFWPLAFAHGFRLAPQAEMAWAAFVKASPNTRCKNGICMR